jgi:hypothetical protein
MVYLALIERFPTPPSAGPAPRHVAVMKGTGRMCGLRSTSGWMSGGIPCGDPCCRAALDDLRDRFGSIYLAAAAYNAGAGKVSRGLRGLPAGPAEVLDVVDVVDLSGTGDVEEEDEVNNDADFFRLYDTRFLRRETKDYVPKLIAAALIAKEPTRYGFVPIPDVPPFAYDSIIVPDQTGLDVVADWPGVSLTDLRDLNPLHPPRDPAAHARSSRCPSGPATRPRWPTPTCRRRSGSPIGPIASRVARRWAASRNAMASRRGICVTPTRKIPKSA